MKGWLVLLVIILFLVSFTAAISITSSAINNESGSSGNEIQTCLDECPTGCAAPQYRICASDGEKYCNTCTIGCYGLTKADNSLCENDEENTQVQANTSTKIRNSFCGSSTLASCGVDNDCTVGGCSNQVCQGKDEQPSVTTCEYTECYNSQVYNINCRCIENKCMWSKLTASQIKNIVQVRNRLKFEDRTKIPCPTSCVCTGSTMKCTLLNGREMTVFAGNSGNVIVQVKGENMTTNVTLYKSPDGKVYGIFKNNETRIVRMLPDQIKEKIRERLQRQLENENITLNEEGSYEYTAQKRARLFFIFPVRMIVRAEIDAETGEVIKVSKPKWWAFLAKDESSEQIVGASCGTVTPGENDNCCKNKGYDVWNTKINECEFSS